MELNNKTLEDTILHAIKSKNTFNKNCPTLDEVQHVVRSAIAEVTRNLILEGKLNLTKEWGLKIPKNKK